MLQQRFTQLIRGLHCEGSYDTALPMKRRGKMCCWRQDVRRGQGTGTVVSTRGNCQSSWQTKTRTQRMKVRSRAGPACTRRPPLSRGPRWFEALCLAVLSSTNLFGGYDILPPVDLFGGYDTEGTCCHSQRGNNDDGGAEDLAFSLHVRTQVPPSRYRYRTLEEGTQVRTLVCTLLDTLYLAS